MVCLVQNIVFSKGRSFLTFSGPKLSCTIIVHLATLPGKRARFCGTPTGCSCRTLRILPRLFRPLAFDAGERGRQFLNGGCVRQPGPGYGKGRHGGFMRGQFYEIIWYKDQMAQWKHLIRRRNDCMERFYTKMDAEEPLNSLLLLLRYRCILINQFFDEAKMA